MVHTSKIESASETTTPQVRWICLLMLVECTLMFKHVAKYIAINISMKGSATWRHMTHTQRAGSLSRAPNHSTVQNTLRSPWNRVKKYSIQSKETHLVLPNATCWFVQIIHNIYIIHMKQASRVTHLPSDNGAKTLYVDLREPIRRWIHACRLASLWVVWAKVTLKKTAIVRFIYIQQGDTTPTGWAEGHTNLSHN